MKKVIFLLFIFSICFGIHSFAKNYNLTDTTINRNAHRVGVLLTVDVNYNQKDKLFSDFVERKLGIGISFSNRKGGFIFYLGLGFKGWKFSFFQPELNDQFISDVNQSYHPIVGNFRDSLVGVSVYEMTNKKEGYYMSGFYTQFLQAGFILTRYRFKPSVSFYLGTEDFVLWTPLAKSLTEHNGNYNDWISTYNSYYEIKAGIDLISLIKKESSFPGMLAFNIGYKRVNYGSLDFYNVPVAAYTNDQIAGKYNSAGRFTIGLDFKIWSNWGDLFK